MKAKLPLLLLMGLFLMGYTSMARENTYTMTFTVDMNNAIAKGIFSTETDWVDVAGDFNEWGAQELLLTQVENTGVYTLTTGPDFALDSIILFKFRINSSWDNSQPWGDNAEYTITEGENSFAYTWLAPNPAIGWANLQWPPTMEIIRGSESSTANAFAQVYIAGITDSNDNPSPYLTVGFGLNPENTDPATWDDPDQWQQAVYNARTGNNHEYIIQLNGTMLQDLPAGTYYYVPRFQLGNDPKIYGGFSDGGGNFWDGAGFVSGVLTLRDFVSANIDPEAFTFGDFSDFDETGAFTTITWNDASSVEDVFITVMEEEMSFDFTVTGIDAQTATLHITLPQDDDKRLPLKNGDFTLEGRVVFNQGEDANFTVTFTDPTWWVAIRVVNQENNMDIANAEVYVQETEEYYFTGNDGWVDFTLPEGQYQLTISAEGFETLTNYPIEVLTFDDIDGDNEYIIALNPVAESYSLTLATNPFGAGTVSGAGQYLQGAIASVSVEPAEGFVFENWMDGLGNIVSSVPGFDYTMPAENVVLTANLTEDTSGLFSVTFNVNMSTAVSFNHDTEAVYITGNFLEWAQPGSDPDNQTLTRVGDSWIYSKTFQLEPGTYQYKYFRNSGWPGGEWEGSPNREITVTENTTTEDTWGYFDDPPALYAVNLQINPEGTGSASGAAYYPEGATVNLQAQPALNYLFENWTQNGSVVSDVPVYTFTMPAEDLTLTANFVPFQFTYSWIDDFEAGIDLWWTPEGSGSTTGIILEDDDNNLVTYRAHETTIVNSNTESTGSMKLAFQWDTTADYEGTSSHMIRQHMPAGNANIPEKQFQPGQALEVWVHGDNSGNRFRLMTRDGIPRLEGSLWYTIDWTGWKRIVWDYNNSANVVGWVNGNGIMEGNNFYFDSFQITRDPEGTTTGGTLYFDDFRIIDPINVVFDITDATGDEVIIIGNVIYPAGQTAFSIFPGTYTYIVQRTGYASYVGEFTLDYEPVLIEVTLDEVQPILFDVTFNVNMITAPGFDPDNDIVYLTGTMLGWAEPSTDPDNQTMARQGESWIWSKTLQMQAGYYEYKYFLNEGWDNGEPIFYGNRTIILSGDTSTEDFWGIPGDPVYQTLTLNTEPSEGGTAEGAGSYLPGQTVALTANPAQGYNFLYWTEIGNIIHYNPTFDFVMPGNNTILTAHFTEEEIPMYNLTLAVNPANSGFVSGSGNYQEGEPVNITATAHTGFTFLNWTDSNGNIISTAANFTYIMPAQSLTLTANFEGETTGTYEVTFTVNMSTAPGFDPESDIVYLTGGMMDWAIPGSDPENQTMTRIDDTMIWTKTLEVDAGNVQYKYFLNAGWDQGEWDGGANREIFVTHDMTTADFWGFMDTPPLSTLTLSASPTEGGAVSGAGDYYENQSVVITATAHEGFVFESWTEEGTIISTEESFVYLMPGQDANLVAHFAVIQPPVYTLTLEASPAEGGTISGAGEYEEGTDISVTATANEGFTFINWTQNGTEISSDANFTYTMPAEDVLLIAHFEADEPELFIVTLLVEPGAGGVVTGEGVYEEGDEVTITATPSQGYIFLRWKNENEVEFSTSPTQVFTMPAMDMILIAVFDLEGNVDTADLLQPEVFPNPAVDEFIIRAGSNIRNIIISDITGKVVYKESANHLEVKIQRPFESGIYLLHIYTDEGVFVRKLQIR
ncbi:MAG: T9SS C-terminal target domain-containing protein [Bacteroidetes bacterium]|nr:MAG: T9SS C-terminal target domain-containing protein [Bacteroidota bacterium]